LSTKTPKYIDLLQVIIKEFTSNKLI